MVEIVMSNSTFSRSVFKRLVLQTCRNQGLFGKGLSLFCCKVYPVPRQNIRLVQIERVCRQQVSSSIRIKIIVGKRDSSGNQQFFSFSPQCFQKVSYFLFKNLELA